jgi:hypothetical protein
VRDTASLFGTVTDSQGAVVPGARITINNAATGVSRSVVTDSSGAYVFSLMPVGSYQLTIELAGFRKYERRNILLQANENIRVDAALDIGSRRRYGGGHCRASGQPISYLNTTVDSRRVVELPLNGRNPADLVLLAPGVSSGASNNSGIGRGPMAAQGAGDHHQRPTTTTCVTRWTAELIWMTW